jgi:nucleoside-diphosphate-sugar epimerase
MAPAAAYTAVVTGISGFIASELAHQLLAKGYVVRGTVRSKQNTEKVGHLLRLAEALPGKLELHEADLLKPGSFDEVVKGADYVFHTASPFFTKDVTDPQKQLVEPAVHGTENVLNAVANAGIKRTVLTSSFASVVKEKAGPSNGNLYIEEDWNDESKPDMDGAHAYRYSKVTAEKTAWDIAKKHGFDLVVINPTFVIGPVLSSRTDATSITIVKGIIEGTNDNITPWVCDVRDIARAHIRAAEVPTAKGRYIVSQGSTHDAKWFSQVLAKHFPNFKFPAGQEVPQKMVLDNSKVQKELGMRLTDPAESIIDMATCLIQLGVAKPVPK